MREEDIKKRVDVLLSTRNRDDDTVSLSHELFFGALNLMTIIHGPKSTQVENLSAELKAIREKWVGRTAAEYVIELARGALYNLKAELEAGIVGSLQKTIAGDVLTDFLQLARAALDERGDDAKNVAAVLTAALFEDTIRRIAVNNGIPHLEKLQDVITELKNQGVLEGPQVGIANSYLNFRNRSLHAHWDQVQRESVASVLGFVEEMLLKHFP